jgi:hypothetical protein
MHLNGQQLYVVDGSSIIRDITKKRYNLDSVPICVRGGVISDITAQLLQLPTDTSLKNIILQVGSRGDQINRFQYILSS